MLVTKQVFFYASVSICGMQINIKKGRNQEESEEKQAMQV